MENRIEQAASETFNNSSSADLAGIIHNANTVNDDYSRFLSGMARSAQPPYFFINEQVKQEGWLIHISVVRPQFAELAQRVISFLIRLNLSFAIPIDGERHSMLLDGRCGIMNVGKVITIYAAEGKQAMEIVTEVLKFTTEFQGPKVLSGIQLGACVYVSYGSSLAQSCFDQHYYSLLSGYSAAIALSEILSQRRLRWPFSILTPLKNKSRTRIIGKRFIPIDALKHDVKGNVLRCIWLKKAFDPHWCVLKQGRQYQSFDEQGRDIRDRLRWQFQTHKELRGKIRIPEVIAYFEVNEDGYLAFEFIDGIPLAEKIANLCKGFSWGALPSPLKCELINYLLQVVELVEQFHKNGFVHRDLNPGNLLVTPDGLVYAIDLELCYHFKTQCPIPAFLSGTAGYMSPQQLDGQTPEISDDIYGLGALLLKSFTSLSPNRFIGKSTDELLTDLVFFLGSPPLAQLIINCLSSQASVRPALKFIGHTLEVYEKFLLAGADNADTIQPEILTSAIVQRAINTLAFESSLIKEQEWLSKAVDTENILANEQMSYSWSPGFCSGCAGILYTFSIAEQFGYAVAQHDQIIRHNYNYLKRETSDFKNMEPGFRQGSYGLAVAIKAMVCSGLVENNIHVRNDIYNLLSKPTIGLNYADGIAGQGICLFYCMDLLKFPSIYGLVHSIAETLIHSQEKEGSWLLPKISGGHCSKPAGLFEGTAGITFYLLVYYQYHQSEKVKETITRSLTWLMSLVNPSKINQLANSSRWMNDPWVEHGFSGVALTFIKAFEVFQDEQYKLFAISILTRHPKYIAANYFTVGNGLSGLGEIYLAAFSVFKEQEWQERAHHIAQFLVHSYSRGEGSSVYWLDSNDTRPTPDYLTGNGGIIQFLMHWLHPGQPGFPFL